MNYILLVNLSDDELETVRVSLEPAQEFLIANDLKEASYYINSFENRIMLAVMGSGHAGEPDADTRTSLLIEGLKNINPEMKILLVSMDKELLDRVTAQCRLHLKGAVCLSMQENFDEGKMSILLKQLALPDPDVLAARSGRPHLVLLVDDEINLRKVICLGLKNLLHCQVLEAEGLKDAADIFYENKSRLSSAVVDFYLSDGEATMLIKGIKKSMPDLPIILTTGEGDYAEKEWFKKIKDLIDVVLPKPFDVKELADQITRLSAERAEKLAHPKPPVLVIDDSPETVKFLNVLIADREIKSAASGEEGLKLFQEFKPSVVFLDFRLPGINGHEVLKKIKEIDPTAKVVVVTIAHDQEIAQEFLKLGAVQVILKPFDPYELKVAVKRHVG